MGLDIGFYTEDDEQLLGLRNHHGLLRLFLDQPHDTIGGYDDFYVTAEMVGAVLEAVEEEMEDAGMTLPELPQDGAQTSGDLMRDLPEDFCDEEPDEWTAALPHYRVLLAFLLVAAEEERTLICGWSA
jgi:hypothetical protein